MHAVNKCILYPVKRTLILMVRSMTSKTKKTTMKILLEEMVSKFYGIFIQWLHSYPISCFLMFVDNCEVDEDNHSDSSTNKKKGGVIENEDGSAMVKEAVSSACVI